MLKVNIALISALLFSCYFAYICWQDEKAAKAEAERINTEFIQYKEDNQSIKQIELNIIETIKNGQAKTDALRNDVDNGLVELRVKVETAERDSAAAGDTAAKALRLARTSQQDYYNLTNAITYNDAIIKGWQQYYCTVIAPKNGTQAMCSDIKK